MKKIYFILLILTSIVSCGYEVRSQDTLSLKLFIEGYYVSGSMNTLACAADTILVDFHDSAVTSNIVATDTAVLLSDGTAICYFPSGLSGHSYYIAIRQFTIIETWSVLVRLNGSTSYDFTTGSSQAYGNNMVEVDFSPPTWGFYSGDINQDGNIDLFDWIILSFGISHGLFGCYPADLNGDGNVDLLDFPVFNANLGIYSHHP